MYIVMRLIGMPKKMASRFYWNLFVPMEIAIAILAMIDSGFIHG